MSEFWKESVDERKRITTYLMLSHLCQQKEALETFRKPPLNLKSATDTLRRGGMFTYLVTQSAGEREERVGRANLRAKISAKFKNIPTTPLPSPKRPSIPQRTANLPPPHVEATTNEGMRTVRAPYENVHRNASRIGKGYSSRELIVGLAFMDTPHNQVLAPSGQFFAALKCCKRCDERYTNDPEKWWIYVRTETASSFEVLEGL